MAIILAILEAQSLISEATRLLNTLHTRFLTTRRNPDQARHLIALFTRFLDELTPLLSNCNENSLQIPEQDLAFFRSRVEQLNRNLTDTCNKLQDEIKRLKTPWHRVTCARRTADLLADIETTAQRAEFTLLFIKPFFANASLMSSQTDQLTAVMHGHAEHLSNAITSANHASTERHRNSFRPSFDVPDNPPHVVLNFQSTASAVHRPDASPTTIEAKLKSAVLRSGSSRITGAVTCSLAHGVAMHGMSGVGKSVALRGLAKDEDVLQRFRHGIYFVPLGKDATPAHVVLQIATIVKASGGEQVGREVLEENNVDNAVSKAKRWFAGMCCLLLIDDAWEENDNGCDIVARLSRIADVTNGSKVVFTTRDGRMTMRREVIRFSERGAYVSLQILLQSAGLEEDAIEPCRDTVKELSKLCGGLPMALAVVGSDVKGRLCSACGATVSYIWEECLFGFQKHRRHLLGLQVDNDTYGNLASAFGSSLSKLDCNMPSKLPFTCPLPFSKMYRALVVLQRQGWAPITVFHLLWETQDEHQALKVLQGFVDANLAQREDRMVNGRMIPGISLHDLHLDFVQAQCGERECQEWHRKLLSRFIHEEASDSNSTGTACRRSWCRDDVFKDEYLRNNLSRHLLSAVLEGELYGLLTNPKWAAMRLCLHESLFLEQDFALMLEHCGLEGTRDLQSRYDAEALKTIVGAAKLSAPYVSRNSSEVWFQLQARLTGQTGCSEVVKSYTLDIEKYAEKPWVKALSPCLPGPGGTVQSTVLCEGEVTSISEAGPDGQLYVCGIGEHRAAAFVSSVFNGQLENTVLLSRGDNNTTYAAAGSSTKSFGVACCASNGTRAVTGHVDGTIQLWNAKTGEPLCSALRGHSRGITCVTISADGRRVASGCVDGTVRLWDVELGQAVESTLQGHSAGVLCIAFSPNGKRVATGSLDNTVRVWDAESGNVLGGALCGHSVGVICLAWCADGKRVVSGSSDDLWDVETGGTLLAFQEGRRDIRIRCLALSDDGTRVAFGSNIDRMVHIWDLAAGQAVRDTFCGHGHDDVVECVAFLADGRSVASGSRDKTLKLWNTESSEAMGRSLPRHDSGVECIVFSANGKLAATGSRDETLIVWDTQTGKALGDALVGHSGGVACASWSPDGNQIASGSHDKTVRMWDARTGQAIGVALHGHSGDVSCVAWSSNGKRVASGSSDRTVRIWEAGKVVNVLRIHNPVTCVGWAFDGKHVSSASLCNVRDGIVQVWNVETGEAIGSSIIVEVRDVKFIALSADGMRVAMGFGTEKMQLWDTMAGKCLRTVEGCVVVDLANLQLFVEGAESWKDNEEDRVRCSGVSIRTGSTSESSVVATLESEPKWGYSWVSRRIVAASGPFLTQKKFL